MPAFTAIDYQALAMVAFLAMALGSILTLFLIMARNGTRNSKLDLPELDDEANLPLKLSQSPPKPAAWERDADWWKQDET